MAVLGADDRSARHDQRIFDDFTCHLYARHHFRLDGAVRIVDDDLDREGAALRIDGASDERNQSIDAFAPVCLEADLNGGAGEDVRGVPLGHPRNDFDAAGVDEAGHRHPGRNLFTGFDEVLFDGTVERRHDPGLRQHCAGLIQGGFGLRKVRPGLIIPRLHAFPLDGADDRVGEKRFVARQVFPGESELRLGGFDNGAGLQNSRFRQQRIDLRNGGLVAEGSPEGCDRNHRAACLRR